MITAWLRSRRIVRLLRRTPRVAIADHEGSLARRIVGEVIALEPLLAPISGRPCVCYAIAAFVLAPSPSGDGTQEWRPIGTEHGGVPFLVTDGSGRARVDPAASELLIRSSEKTDERHAGARRYLLARGHAPPHPHFHLREGIIGPGARVAVAGMGVRVPDTAPPTAEVGYRSGAEIILAMSGAKDLPLLISDHPAAAA
jgi:hypothetical protein